ncbi:hypothetical protein [uncultured Tenacibaculum sp.]|uniref:hypothetical protein n=1 Tax=uncultured Tenacibaculum sp. TaxID=174713 RepID=UPI002633608F|nr:hypothetical protein [uncultured Tenacibaculum sp.]
MNNIDELTSLLREKEDLKFKIKSVTDKIKGQKKQIEKQKQRAENGQTNTLAFEQRELPAFILELQNAQRELKALNIKIQVLKNNFHLQQPKITKPILPPFEQITRELNIIKCIFECQFMEASTNVSQTPILHSKGRYLAGMYHITSNTKMLLIQEYIKHYTERFETTSNTVLLENELLEIHQKANGVLNYYNENLTLDSSIVKKYKKDIPNDFDERIEYFIKHRGIILVKDLYPQHIVFDIDFQDEKAKWTYQEYNFITTNYELAIFCQKLIDFIEKFDLKQNKTSKNISNYSKNQIDTLEVKNSSPTTLFNDIRENGFPEYSLDLYDQIYSITEGFNKTKLALLKNDLNYKIEEYKLLQKIDPHNLKELDRLKIVIERFNNLKKFIENVIEPNELNNQENPLTIQKILQEQNNLIPNISINDVYSHFKVLTSQTNKNNEFYLTEKQLLTFIKSTFIDLNPIKQDFNCKGFLKKRVRKVFYDFYFNNKNKERNHTKLKRKYFNIMNDAFNGFNENDYTDFAK